MLRVHASAPTPRTKPLIIRLRNWVGDVILGIPLLRMLEAHGYELHLIGKAWAQDLLLGEGWLVQPGRVGWLPRVQQLREMRTQCIEIDPSFDRRLNAITMPFSFSSALDMRCAGLQTVGVAHEGRSLFLGRALPRTAGLHELQAYLELATPFLPRQSLPCEAPAEIGLAVAKEHQQAADALCLAHQIEPGFVMLCPFAGGTFDKMPKTWSGFSELAEALHQLDRTVVLCPGPGEEAQAQAICRNSVILTGVNLGVYAALLRRCALMVSNDTGPGHLSAAVGAATLSVLGPTNPAQWRPWGSGVQLIQAANRCWPNPQAVINQALEMLRTTTSEPKSNAS